MQIQTVIDDHLYQQAVAVTGIVDKQALLEEALRLLIQSKKQHSPDTTEKSSDVKPEAQTTNTTMSHFQASVEQNYQLGELLAKWRTS